MMSFQHIRNATSVLTLNGKKLLIDPMLSDVGELPPVPFTRTLRRNPLTPLPVPLQYFDDMDAVLLTHRHFDHLDKKALSVLNKTMPVLCQPEDEAFLRAAGFVHIHPIASSLEWNGIRIERIPGRHAPGFAARLLGPVSGYVLSTPNEGSIYIAGDCILTPAIEETFRQYQPNVAVLNTPRAQMLLGTIITMTAEDIVRIADLAPNTRLIAVHMDAISHCTFKRRHLRAFLQERLLAHKVDVPEDGELLTLE
ncbi:L-ascorbate metabolism protein UlaG (beta-lactamase superfamily) [Paenibacillus phyllosphaerae]|uniref:L-ascorbate metabolism protein UlaG (Beta-lactamase superfamily) n=1 Tax=Paenibacillus phyllosphaerae TaxID=274593 RepID=A0A7W5B1P6_9BACL|nr:MBL fold metallo-hydrolase [Paenibacillus phyllosphaerae]MBB3112788.1 L-ascorbate metabolism protein UlaG (beta-lactamase superfamily) [Paenibacillus phyllosphaerae]